MKKLQLSCAILILALGAVAEYKIQDNPLMTTWGEKITPENAWREYPRPQLTRNNWQNLNGLWQYAVNPREEGQPEKWEGEILVPFAIETPLSGVKRLLEPNEQLWYRRSFDAALKPDERLILHFGSVDFRTQVFVNGVEATDVPHESGNLPFSIDITDLVKPGANELILSVWDPTGTYHQSLGKQSLKPAGCFYTRSSGIWQTVWTEVVPATYVARYQVVTDIDRETVAVTVFPAGELMGASCSVAVVKGGTTLAKGNIAAWNKPLILPVKNPKLWSPESPELYDLEIALTGQNGAVDNVKGYFGMRKIHWQHDEKGVPRLYLNNQKTFMYGTLDQGWWPDGFLTPPSDEAMAFDIQFLKDAGFNMMRKHIKIEPLRYYYLCDKMGILLWQDMPSGPGNAENRYQLYREELKRMVDLLQTCPSIVLWVPYNEGWGQPKAAKTNQVFAWLKRYDPTRLLDGPSGWHDYGVGDCKDKHHYSEPQMFPVMKDRVSVLGEFGGIGFMVKDHLWAEKSWGYVTDPDPDAFFERYKSQMDTLADFAMQGLAAAVYTQTTDVEIETNGLLTYDRKVAKKPAADFKKASLHVYEAAKNTQLQIKTAILESGQNEGKNWKYTTDKPADNWFTADFDDKAWETGLSGFGNKAIQKDHKTSRVRTPWETNSIWIRTEFQFDGNPEDITRLALEIFYDENAQVFLNGIKIASFSGYNNNYDTRLLPADAIKALKKGKNTLAASAINTVGGAYLDLGIVGITYK